MSRKFIKEIEPLEEIIKPVNEDGFIEMRMLLNLRWRARRMVQLNRKALEASHK
ncbi:MULTISPECIES: hypothetical protein [unclassified Paenibacillus]|uniref:hypothetical protein n=1 Tax=unclassified Paenibacillus TaxID=185978 RepID=UPI0030FB0A80